MGNKVSMAANIRLILASDKDAQLRCYTLGSTSTVARLLKITIAMPKCQAYQTEFLFAVDYASATARPRGRVEIVMNEMRQLKLSADFFLQIHPMIFLGVQECKELLYRGPLVATLVTLF